LVLVEDFDSSRHQHQEESGLNLALDRQLQRAIKNCVSLQRLSLAYPAMQLSWMMCLFETLLQQLWWHARQSRCLRWVKNVTALAWQHWPCEVRSQPSCIGGL
jgi:hypothetical protein